MIDRFGAAIVEWDHTELESDIHKSEFPELADENRRIWDANAQRRGSLHSADG